MLPEGLLVIAPPGCGAGSQSNVIPLITYLLNSANISQLNDNNIMADSTPKSYHTDPTLYLYTSLTAGSSHIITATSRLETILKANKIPFLALDVATDEKARMLWGRRAGKRKLPGLVRMGMVVGVRSFSAFSEH